MTEEVLKQFDIDILEKRIARDPLVKAMQLALTEATKIEKSNKPRPATDADLFKVLKNTISGLKEVISVSDRSFHNMEYEQSQIELFNSYLPKMLSEKDLLVVISGIMANNGITCSAAGMKDMGIVMGTLKEDYSGRYDGKLASQIFKNIIS